MIEPKTNGCQTSYGVRALWKFPTTLLQRNTPSIVLFTVLFTFYLFAEVPSIGKQSMNSPLNLERLAWFEWALRACASSPVCAARFPTSKDYNSRSACQQTGESIQDPSRDCITDFQERSSTT